MRRFQDNEVFVAVFYCCTLQACAVCLCNI